jgi:adenine-specific DNA-methyltransferase
MIYPRLRVARDLLADDGVIFISIDDGEVVQLRKICDDIYGETNFVANFIWYITGHTDNQDNITNVHEFILCYAKNIDNVLYNSVVDPNIPANSKIHRDFAENSITKNGLKNPPSEIILPEGFPCEIESLKIESSENIDEFINEVNNIGYISRELTQKYSMSYPARINKIAVENFCLSEKCRVYSGWMNVDKLKQFIDNNCEPFEDNGTMLRFYLSKNRVIYYHRSGRKSHYIQTVLENMGTTELNKYMLERMGLKFDYPKPVELIQYLLTFVTSTDSIILDFFSGSATTAHAVMQLNAEDGGNRKFIMVQLPELCDESTEAAKAGYKNICEIGKERIRRAGVKIKTDNADKEGIEKLDIGFRVLKLDSGNMKDVYYTPQDMVGARGAFQIPIDGLLDNIKPGRGAEDLLFQVMLDLGISLSSKIEKRDIGGKAVFSVADNYLIACFDPATDESVVEIAKSKPYYAVFRDNSFAGDAALVNFEQIFKTYSPTTIRKVL